MVPGALTVLACKALWADEIAEFHGKYVDIEPSWSWPKPVQRPHPPIVMGASSTDLHFSHIIEFCDMWMPLQGRWPIEEAWQKLRAAAAAKPDEANLARFHAPVTG